MPFGAVGLACRGACKLISQVGPINKGYGLGGPPHPVIVTIRDNKDYIRVLLYSIIALLQGGVSS